MNKVKKEIKKINIKHLSIPTLILLLIFTVLKISRPDIFDKITDNNVSPAQNKNINSDNTDQPLAKDSKWRPTIAPYYAEENMNANSSVGCSGRQTCTAKVTKVVDGDTIEISTGEKVRYIGVDTPETRHPAKGVECFGKEASGKNRELVLGKDIRLEKDVSDKDKYGRLLRYIYLNSDNLFVNDFLARNGFAHTATFPPDVKFSKQFVEAEREARENHRGLWAPGVCP